MSTTTTTKKYRTTFKVITGNSVQSFNKILEVYTEEGFIPNGNISEVTYFDRDLKKHFFKLSLLMSKTVLVSEKIKVQ